MFSSDELKSEVYHRLNTLSSYETLLALMLPTDPVFNCSVCNVTFFILCVFGLNFPTSVFLGRKNGVVSSSGNSSNPITSIIGFANSSTIDADW